MAQIKPGSTFTDGRIIASTNDLHSHSNKTALDNVSGTNTGNETTTSIGTMMSGATAKITPVDADMVPLMDSAASNIIKKLSWVNIKATLKTYFDTLYNNYTHATGFTNQPGTALTGSNVISQITVNTEGHVTATTSRALTAANVGAEPTISSKNTAFNKNYGTTATDVKVNGTQSVGSVDAIARIDHVHPTDTSRASTAIATTGASGLMSSIDKSKLDGVATNATANTGTVTSVAAGNGLNFTTITGSGSVTLGTPGTITNATTNGVTSTSHTHALTLVKADITALGIPAQDTVTSINGKTGVIVKADIVALGVPAQDTVTSINGKTGAIAKADIVDLGIPASDTVYTHPTAAGNKHIPTGGATGQFLKYSASGTAVWAADNDTITTINGKTGAIVKADITALGIPAQDTTYTAGAGLTLTGTVFTPVFGTTAGTITQGNDSRLSNARTPLAHDHTMAQITNLGSVASVNTNASTVNFLRGDGIWATPPNTVYTEITVAEIDGGTASTLRTITARRVGYILEKIQTSISSLTKVDVGLENVDNTSDLNKPISNTTRAALDTKRNTNHVFTWGNLKGL